MTQFQIYFQILIESGSDVNIVFNSEDSEEVDIDGDGTIEKILLKSYPGKK